MAVYIRITHYHPFHLYILYTGIHKNKQKWTRLSSDGDWVSLFLFKVYILHLFSFVLPAGTEYTATRNEGVGTACHIDIS